VVISLDTSGSMQPLLDAARLKLWEIVNDLALAEPTPHVRVALLTYGHVVRRPEDTWVRVWTPFTDNLDLISQRLFEAKISGDTEYVGRVIDVALRELEWTDSEESLRLLFVVGNEPADQDPLIKLEDMSQDAIQRGIVVNAIFCGSHKVPAAKSWMRLAELSQGHFATIDHRKNVSMMASPFDEELAELGTALNATYLPVGSEGEDALANQEEQDKKARKLHLAAAATRAQTKAGTLYTTSWDLLDLLESGGLTLEEIPDEELPEVLRVMSLEERELYLDEMLERRAELRQRINELGKQRRRHVSEQAEAQGRDDSWAFDSAIRKAMRRHAREKGFEFAED
jgi:hypothetical protein